MAYQHIEQIRAYAAMAAAEAHGSQAKELAALGRIEESLIEGHTAVELDPGSVSARRNPGRYSGHGGQYLGVDQHPLCRISL